MNKISVSFNSFCCLLFRGSINFLVFPYKQLFIKCILTILTTNHVEDQTKSNSWLKQRLPFFKKDTSLINELCGWTKKASVCENTNIFFDKWIFLIQHSGKKCHIFLHFEKGQFSDKNVICVKMSIRIAKIPKIPRVSIYMATFELKLVETLWFLLSISIPQNQLVSWKIWTKIVTFFPLCASGREICLRKKASVSRFWK